MPGKRERVVLFPLQQGSRTPEQFRAAILAVMQERQAGEDGLDSQSSSLTNASAAPLPKNESPKGDI